MLFAIWIMAVPFLGFPVSVSKYILLASGAIILLIALRLNSYPKNSLMSTAGRIGGNQKTDEGKGDFSYIEHRAEDINRQNAEIKS